MSEKTTTEEEDLLPSFAFLENWLGLPEPLLMLRKKLYIKAKQEPGFRFYAWYNLGFRPPTETSAQSQAQWGFAREVAFRVCLRYCSTVFDLPDAENLAWTVNC